MLVEYGTEIGPLMKLASLVTVIVTLPPVSIDDAVDTIVNTGAGAYSTSVFVTTGVETVAPPVAPLSENWNDSEGPSHQPSPDSGMVTVFDVSFGANVSVPLTAV